MMDAVVDLAISNGFVEVFQALSEKFLGDFSENSFNLDGLIKESSKFLEIDESVGPEEEIDEKE